MERLKKAIVEARKLTEGEMESFDLKVGQKISDEQIAILSKVNVMIVSSKNALDKEAEDENAAVWVKGGIVKGSFIFGSNISWKEEIKKALKKAGLKYKVTTEEDWE